MAGPTLYSYCIPFDDGAAPNPYWGVCTLAICKPVIRRVTEVGDWVVGTGSKSTPIGDVSAKVVYAMRVDEKMTMSEYDTYTKAHLRGKIPDWSHRERRRRLGDSIYDFSQDPPVQRPGVHLPANQKTDLGGLHVLLSRHWYYFGDQPVPLPSALVPIVKQGQGHKSRANAPYVASFVEWIDNLGVPANTLSGAPQLDLFGLGAACAEPRRHSDEADESFACGAKHPKARAVTPAV